MLGSSCHSGDDDDDSSSTTTDDDTSGADDDTSATDDDTDEEEYLPPERCGELCTEESANIVHTCGEDADMTTAQQIAECKAQCEAGAMPLGILTCFENYEDGECAAFLACVGR